MVNGKVNGKVNGEINGKVNMLGFRTTWTSIEVWDAAYLFAILLIGRDGPLYILSFSAFGTFVTSKTPFGRWANGRKGTDWAVQFLDAYQICARSVQCLSNIARGFWGLCTWHVRTCRYIPLLTIANSLADGSPCTYVPNLSTTDPVIAKLQQGHKSYFGAGTWHART